MQVSASRSIRLLSLAAVAGLLILRVHKSATVSAASTGEEVPVLVELFTSEGCSSCPPADALLANLDAKQPVSGARVIVLSEHVTYWNSLGWRDPFSSDAMTERQHQYAGHFGLGDVYTPQAVIDGAVELVGSDQRGMERALARAAASPKGMLQIQTAQWQGDILHFSVHAAAGADATAVLVAALAEDAVQSNVTRGENGGRTLRHVAVVRILQQMDHGTQDGRDLLLQPSLSYAHRTMRLVVFLADRRSGHVLALAEQTIRP